MITFPGPCSALVVLPTTSDQEGIARVLELERSVHETLAGIRETVPAFNKLLIEGEPESWDGGQVEADLRRLIDVCFRSPVSEIKGTTLTLPACYDVALAPDLAELARTAGLTAKQVAQIHSAETYTVLATGFAPGFAYLGSIDERIAMPRRPDPRPVVEVGSLAIADRRTGIYPSTGPGGWRLIGRVPPSLFADVGERISRFEPGMRVNFRSIERADFDAESA